MAQEWCKQNGNIKYVETSAKIDINVSKAFYALAEHTLESIDPKEQIFEEEIINQNNNYCCY